MIFTAQRSWIRAGTTALATLAAGLSVTGCESGGSSGPAAGPTTGTALRVPISPPRAYSTDALLFAGTGTWSDEVAVLEQLLLAKRATYSKVSSAALDAMSVDDLAKFGVMIFPGGSGGAEAAGLSVDTHARLRQAVQQRGVNYVGFCAGSFIAVAPAPAPDHDVSYGLGVAAGPELQYYYLENQGTDIAMTLQTFADGTQADILWYGGPVTPDLPGGVIARYPDGKPAISEQWAGQGFVVLSGGHPAANSAMLASLGMQSTDGTHPDLAWKLISAALHQQPWPAF